MSRTCQVIWAVVAERDLREIIEYIASDSLSNTLTLMQTIKQKASGLHASPERGRIVPELQVQGILTFRELIVPPWRMIYNISGSEVHVLSVIDSRRNVEDILLQRLVYAE